MNDEQQKTGD